MAKGPNQLRVKSAKPHKPSPPVAFISLSALARWMVPGLAVLLFVATWVRFVQVAANNHPPIRHVVLEGDEPWTEREILRARCGFNGQFLAVGDRIWIPCAPGPGRWELIRWDLARGVAERRWRATHSPKDPSQNKSSNQGVDAPGSRGTTRRILTDMQREVTKRAGMQRRHERSSYFKTGPMDSSTVEVVQKQGLFLAPIIAAAVRLPVGDLALVLHGQKPLTPVELVIVHSGGGLAHHPLPDIKPGGLVGFAYINGRYELLTANCRRHVFEPGKPLVSAPLADCPYDGKTVVEWAQHTPKGWRFIYARQSQTPTHYLLHLVEPGQRRARPLGKLREATKTTRGEKLDMSPGNVLPVAMSQWPTHRLVKGAITPLEQPPKSLTAGLERVSPNAKQIYLLGKHGLRRLQKWSALAMGDPIGDPAPPPGRVRSRSIHRWRWLVHLPTRWLAGESLGKKKGLRLAATAPNRGLDIPLARFAPEALAAIPARGGGIWLFDTQGRYIKIDDSLRRTDTPGLVDRIHRIWRLHHLQRDHLAKLGGRVQKRSRLLGLAHRLALPVVLLGLPLLALILLPLARRAGRRIDPTRPLGASLTRPAWPWVVTAALYLAAAGSLLWPFWQVTSAF